LESNFNNPFAADPDGQSPATEPETAAPDAAPPAAEATLSPGFARFRSCRWQQPAEGGNAEYCTHREVKPYAGTSSFDADAWCPDCAHYKLRRTPKKRTPTDEYSY
jgi:hypothetical protein